MQGIIVTPSGDVWALDFTNDKVVFMPKGDPARLSRSSTTTVNRCLRRRATTSSSWFQWIELIEEREDALRLEGHIVRN